MPSRWTIVLHSILSLIPLAMGVYVLLEEKMIIAGKYSGDIYEFEYPANIVMAVSMFLASAFILLVLVDKPIIRKSCTWIFFLSLILFVTSSFI